MKVLKRVLLLFVSFGLIPFARADLFVEAITSVNVNVTTSIDYISTDQIPPSGNFSKAVIGIDGFVVAESSTPSGTFNIIFDSPGTVDFFITTYGVDGNVINTVIRTITVFGVGMIQPGNNEMIPLGSQIFLGAEAVFSDKIVDYVSFDFSKSGTSAYSSIRGSRDYTYPYSYLYEPPSVGVWDIRAIAHHPGGGMSFSSAVSLQVSSNNRIDQTYVTILDPSDGTSVQAGVLIKINVDVSTNGAPIQGLDMYVDGILLNAVSGTDLTFPFQFDWIPLRPGNYSLVAIAKDNRGTKIASNEIKVIASDDRPHVELLSPQDGSTFVQGKSITLIAIAIGQGGARERVKGVEFLVNGNAIPVDATGQLTLDDSAPYSTIWTPEFSGSYLVQARVIDSVTGTRYQSPAFKINITVAAPPVALMRAPYSGDLFYTGEIVTLRAIGYDASGIITGMDFYVNDHMVGSGIAQDGSYHFEYIFSGSGLFQIKALAYSDRNRQVFSSPIWVTVDQKSGQRPEVVIVSPVSSSQYKTGESVQIEASVQDDEGFVSAVRFYVNRNLIGNEVTSFPFISEPYTFISAGTYDLGAVAIDNDGNLSKRVIVKVKVQDPEIMRPVVSISSPSDKRIYEVGNSVFIEVDAEDMDGNIAGVSFSIDGIQLGEPDSAYPYQSDFYTIESPGLFRVVVTAVDNDGNLSSPASLVFYAVPADPGNATVFNPLESNEDFIVQIFLDLFYRGPTDSEMNRYLEKLEFGTLTKAEVVESLYSTTEFQNLRYSQNAFQAIIGDWPSPLEFSSALQGLEQERLNGAAPVTDDVGDSFDSAHFLNAENSEFSGVLEQNGDVDMFSFQVIQKTLVTLTSTGPFDLTGSLYNSDGDLLEYNDDSGVFFNFAIQRVLLPGNYFLAIAGWAGTTGTYQFILNDGDEMIIPQDSSISYAELNHTISFLYSSNGYINQYGPIQNMSASENNRRNHFNQLFVNRFGNDPTMQQSRQGASRISSAESIESFTASFVINDKVGLNDYIYNLPDTKSRDDGAFLLRSLLKRKPNTEKLESLTGMGILQQVETILADVDYLSRFDPLVIEAGEEIVPLSIIGSYTGINDLPKNSIADFSPEAGLIQGKESPFSHLESVEGWKYLDWFGWFSDLAYPWVYHEKMGWVEINPINSDEMWMWHQRFDWVYASKYAYPYLYHYENEKWIQLDFGEQIGVFQLIEVPSK